MGFNLRPSQSVPQSTSPIRHVTPKLSPIRQTYHP
jgi:hypothetical protein